MIAMTGSRVATVTFLCLAIVASGACASGAVVTAGATAEGDGGWRGFAVTPARLALGSAGVLREESAVVFVRLLNEQDRVVQVSVFVEGTVASWMTPRGGPEQSMGARSARVIAFDVQPPATAPAGVSEGQVRFVARSTDPPRGSGAAVDVALVVPVTINVAGTRAADFALQGVRVTQGQATMPLTFGFSVVNTGNVREAPVFDLAFADVTGRIVLRERHVMPAMDVREAAAQEVVTRAGLPSGTYRVTYVLEGNGKAVTRGDFDVRVLPPGIEPGSPESFTDGEVPASAPVIVSRVGERVRVETSFRNTGPVPIAGAKLVAEVFRDGKSIGVMTGDSLRVEADRVTDLALEFDDVGTGLYMVKAHVSYDGMRTADESAGMALTSSAHDDAEVPGVGVVGVIGLAVGVARVVRGMRPRRR